MAAGIDEALNAGGRMVIPPYSVTSNKDLARFQVGNPWAGAGGGCYIASDGTLQHSLDPYILWGVSNTKLRVAFRQMGMVTRFSVGRQELVGGTLLFLGVYQFSNITGSCLSRGLWGILDWYKDLGAMCKKH